MSTVVLGHHPEITDWLERRRALGQDGRDEVWEGVYHVAPLEQPHNSMVAAEILHCLYPLARQAGLSTLAPFNIGTSRTNFRCPDGGWIAAGSPLSLYMPTATAVLEVLSPGDETYDKFDFYFGQGVQEILVAHPTDRWIKCYSRGAPDTDKAYSAIFQVSMSELVAQIAWP